LKFTAADYSITRLDCLISMQQDFLTVYLPFVHGIMIYIRTNCGNLVIYLLPVRHSDSKKYKGIIDEEEGADTLQFRRTVTDES
jgi:hypothetical protein